MCFGVSSCSLRSYDTRAASICFDLGALTLKLRGRIHNTPFEINPRTPQNRRRLRARDLGFRVQ